MNRFHPVADFYVTVDLLRFKGALYGHPFFEQALGRVYLETLANVDDYWDRKSLRSEYDRVLCKYS